MRSEVERGEVGEACDVLGDARASRAVSTAMAHDLKAPLVVMRQLALALGEETTAEGRRMLADEMVTVSEKALRQVNDLMKVSRLSAREFRMEPVGVRGLCEEVCMEMRPLFKFEARGLEVDYRNRARLAVANRELLRSVVYNFCANAVQYSEMETKSVLSVADAGGMIRVKVRDFGPQLPLAIWQEIQGKGLRQPVAMATRPGNSGVGLYVASEFARYMGTKVGAIRHRDGVSFYVDLVASEQARLF